MTTRTFTRLYDNHDDAVHVVQALEAAGIPHGDISLVANNADSRYGDTTASSTAADTSIGSTGLAGGTLMAADGVTPGTAYDVADTTASTADDTDTVTDAESTGAGTGATIGTILGGGAGLLAGLGMLAIPGVGPIVAAGWLVATLTGAGVGAAGGGLLGSLTGAGVPEEHAHVYAEGVRRGGTLVTVRADDGQADRIEAILDQHTAVDVTARQADYQGAGWSGFDETAPALSTDEVKAERSRRVIVT